MDKKIVIAGNYAQFVAWCRENKLSPKDAIYADREEKLMGLVFFHSDVVKTGEYWKSQISDAFLLSRLRHP